MKIEFQSSVKGGLPVLVTCKLYRAEPDIGVGETAEVVDLHWLSGKSLTAKVWASIPERDFDRLEAEAMGQAFEAACTLADYRYEQMRDRKMEAQMERDGLA